MSNMQPTTGLRFIEREKILSTDANGLAKTACLVKILQQRWVDIDTGESRWVDVPLENKP